MTVDSESYANAKPEKSTFGYMVKARVRREWFEGPVDVMRTANSQSSRHLVELWMPYAYAYVDTEEDAWEMVRIFGGGMIFSRSQDGWNGSVSGEGCPTWMLDGSVSDAAEA